METAELGPTQRPLLRSSEKIICIQNKVGLYQGAERDLEHDCGTVYLTSQRLFYVDQEQPRERSVMVWLQAIQRCTLHSGFLYTSSKIHVYLRAANERQGNSSGGGGSNSSGGTASGATEAVNDEWKCTICEHTNRGVPKCALCGVTRQRSDSDGNGTGGGGGDQAAVRCPTCTFDNHASMTQCEMCDSPLAPDGSPGGTTNGGGLDAGTCSDERPQHRTAGQTSGYGGGGDDSLALVKLSFRGGGATAFFPALREAVSNATWLVVGFEDGGPQTGVTPTTAAVPSQQQQQQQQQQQPAATRRPTAGGISTIVSAAHESSRARDVTLRSAFSDLDALTEKANEIVSMAEHIATQLNSPAASKLRGGGSNSSDEDSAARADAFRQYLLDLGIDSPVTRDTAGAVFHDELARELCDYLENYVSQSGGSVALVDAYCLYNRAREFALVYPADFVQACGKFEALRLPLRLRTYPSGLLALEDAAGAGDASVVERVAAYVRSFGPLMATDLAAFDDCPVTLAEERLWLCERSGELCRDESVEGVRFYANVFRLHVEREREREGVY